MSVEIGVAYLSIVPSMKNVQANLTKELAPVSGIAAVEGGKAGKALGGQLTAGLAGADIGKGLAASTERAAGTGERVLSRFAQRTGGLFQSLDRQLGNFGGPFTGNLTTIGTTLRTVAAGEKNVALGASELQRVGTAAYVGIGLAAVGFGAASIKAALGAEQAHAQLNQAIKATKGSYEDYGKAIDSTVTKLAGFGFDQEEVDASLAKLTRAARDPAKALQLIGVAADIARARNVDLGTASQILVNIEAGRIRGLAQLGISTKDANGKTIDSETAVKRITALYGGAAAASAKTYAGELQAVGATAHNLEEDLGGKLLPAVANVGKGLLSGVHGFETVNEASRGWLGTLAGAAFVGGAVVITVTKIASGIEKLTALLNVNKAATEGLAATQAAAASGEIATVAGGAAGAASTVLPARSAVSEASLTIARSQLAEATAAVTEAQLQFDAALLASAGAEAGDVTAATALTEADNALALAEERRAAAQAQVIALTEGETVATSGLAGAMATLTGVLAGAAIGFLLGKKAGDELNSVLTQGSVNAKALETDLLNLNTNPNAGLPNVDVGRIASDLNHQISGHGPIQFGKSLLDSVTGGDAHRAKADIANINSALKDILQTQGVTAASEAYSRFRAEFVAAHGNVVRLDQDLGPFFSDLDLARAKADATGSSVSNLGGSFTDLADSFAKDSALLGIADQFQSAKDALDQVNQLKLDAVGQGEKSIQAAQQEQQAQQSLSDAYRSQAQAATSLQDAKAKLAQFDSATDTRIRSLQRQQITARVVTTPEEARQKEIDILSFDENTSNQRRDLQKQVASAENGVASATRGVERAQKGVSDAAAARRQIQVDAAKAIAGAERKAQEATDAVAAAIQNASKNQQIGNSQLQGYVNLLSQLETQVAPNSPLAKSLNALVHTMRLGVAAKQALAGSLPIRGPVGPGGTAAIVQPGAQPIAGPQAPSRSGKTVDYHPTYHVHGSDVPTRKQLDDINRLQGMRISIAAGRGG